MKMCPASFFVVCFVVIMKTVATMDQKDCSCECNNLTDCFTLTGCDCSFPQMTFQIPYCNAGNINAVGLKMTVTGMHSTSTTLNKEFDLNRDHLVSGRFSFSFNSTVDEYDYSALESRHVTLKFTVLSTRHVDTGGYTFTITERPCPSSGHGNVVKKQLFEQAYNLSVSNRYDASPRCLSYHTVSNNLSRYTLYCSVNIIYPPVEIDILSSEPCVWRKLKTSSKTEKTVRVSFEYCDLTSIMCETRQNHSQSAGNPNDHCSFHFSATIHTVPPRVLLSHNGSTLINATYDKEYTNQMYVGETTYVEEGTQVNVNCLAEGAKPEAILTWTKNEHPVDGIFNMTTTRNLIENRTFDTTSSLQFVANEENVIITCNSSLNGTDIETLVSATFLTYVKPTVFFLINGKKVADSVYVPENEYVNITCFAKGARPAADITLEGDNLNMGSHANRASSKDSTTFDGKSTLTVQTKDEKQTFSCTSTVLEIDHTETISLELKTFVLPKPVITVNGKRSDDFSFDPGDQVTILCNASAARPTPRLTLTWNGVPFHDTKSESSGSPGVIVFFNFLPKHGDVVMCLSFLDKVNITEIANVTFYDNALFAETFGENFLLPVVIAFTTLVLVLLLVFIVYISARKCKGSQYADLAVNQGICMEDTSNALVRAQPADPQKEYLTNTNIAYPKPPDLDLPKVPSNPDVHQYCDLPEENAYEMNFHQEYYSDMSSIDANRKMFSGKDVCFILNMKTGHIYNRWMGSIAVSKEEKKCVILSTVTDTVFRKNEIQWDKFVKQMLEVPEKRNLIKVEGIGISKGKLYLIHEHITCETLDVRVSALFSRTEVIGHVLGIIEGLEIIQSSGLVHPGLSTKKILLSEQGVCKLYDFCLSDDATNIVRIKKSRMVYTLNQFAPEALLRDEYNKTSDIWSVAVVIWGILSCGSCPFPNEEQQPDSQHVKLKLPETWPKKYKFLRNKLLYECWNEDALLRPTIYQLKSSFAESFESLDTYGASDIRPEEIPSSYVQMKGITKTENES